MKKYTHLSQEERTLITHYHDSGLSICAISQKIGRDKSTISRELARNSNKHAYNPQTASMRYLSRRQRPRRLDLDPKLQEYVLDRLYEGHSPEIISLRLKRFQHIEGLPYISHETLYQWLYRPAQKAKKYYKLLVQGHAKRGRRKRVHRGKIHNRVSIHERSSLADQRLEVGHWEADLMSFKANRQHMLVLHERVTRYTATIKLQSKTAKETIEAIIAFFKAVPSNIVKSITFDNGMEFSSHFEVKKQLKIPTYFCDVYASWQKGGIENMNGRLRRDLPRKTDLLSMDKGELEQIVISHNIMPRKVLGGISPIEALAKYLNKDIIFVFNQDVALRN